MKVADAWVVATDSPEVAAACEAFGAPVVLTSAAHASGTDRVAEVAALPEYAGFGIIVNVQGDEPFIDEAHVRESIGQVRRGWDIGTVATPVGSPAAWRDSSIVKVTRRSDGAALYFSRAPIPFPRDGEPDAASLGSALYLRHVGVYAYTRAALMRWVALPPHALEQTERLEQLRPLAAGLTIGVGVVARSERGVDTAADADRAERRLRALTWESPRSG
jgi:3-deoxy-manno-octulosonate cytidylyltransferase (CMP-KDO synthetase)